MSKITKLQDELRNQKAEAEYVHRNHLQLLTQRQGNTALLRRFAEMGNESLSKLGVSSAAIDGSNISTLIPFLVDFVGRLTGVVERIRSFRDRQVSVAT